jgi:hypothetical protein
MAPPMGSFVRLEKLSFGGTFHNKGLHLLFPLPALKELSLTGIDTATDASLAQVR